jgi:hypothetical protein
MAFDVSQFKGRVAQSGFIQTNKYEVAINFDNAGFASSVMGQMNFAQIARELRERCVSASLPGLALRTQDVNRYGLGVTEKMPFSGNYTEITLSFLCDRHGAVNRFMYGWLNSIFSVTGSVAPTATFGRDFYTAEYKDNYSATIDIVVYDNAAGRPIVYRLYKAFPISMNDIAVSWSDNNNLMKLTGTFTFKEWQIDNSRVALNLPSFARPGAPTGILPVEVSAPGDLG